MEGRPAISHQPAEEMGGDKGPARRPHHCGRSGRGRRTAAVGDSESRAAAPGWSVLRCVLSDPRVDPGPPPRDPHATRNRRKATAL